MGSGSQVVASGDAESQHVWFTVTEDPHYQRLCGVTIWDRDSPAIEVLSHTDTVLLIG